MPAVSRPPAGGTAPRQTARGALGPTGRQDAPHCPSRAAEPPPSRQRVRRTRMWMLLLLLTPVCLAGISLLAFATGGPPEPTVHPLATPPGWYAVTDADFGYAVPDAYRQNITWTDQNGDFLYGRAGAFVAETLLVTKSSPTAASPPPASFRSFGQTNLAGYALHGGHTIRVPGTDFAFEETMTRPGGYRAEVIDAWERYSSTQIWLLVRSPAPVTGRVISSLQG